MRDMDQHVRKDVCDMALRYAALMDARTTFTDHRILGGAFDSHLDTIIRKEMESLASHMVSAMIDHGMYKS